MFNVTAKEWRVTVQQAMSDGIDSSLLGNCKERVPCAQAADSEGWKERDRLRGRRKVESVKEGTGGRGKKRKPHLALLQ